MFTLGVHMPWWGWLLMAFFILAVIFVVFIIPLILVICDCEFVSDKAQNFAVKRDKIIKFINEIVEFEANRDGSLFDIYSKTKVYQRFLGKYGVIKVFTKFGDNRTVKNFRVIADSVQEIKTIMLEDSSDSNVISQYCGLMVDKLYEVLSIYNDLIDQLNEVEESFAKKYIYYVEKIIVLPVSAIVYIFTRPFTIANGDFNIYDKIEISKWWQVLRFLLSIAAEISGIISLFISLFN